MQKKSLLVALFCGALCLVGCIKNEESASVAQVRIAKANELNSIADLNKAKAQAELIYANAEATIAQAEAKLREANAALVLAKAETEKVRAELLKVRVKLAEVKVDEEELELKRMEAELEVYLAQYEAEIAQAEAAKQAWVNALNNLMAQAEIDAIYSAKRLLEAEQNLESYVLTLAGQKADSAKAYADLYFKAYDEVQKLQKEQIVIKAEKALVEAGALEIRDALHYQMARVDEKIAEKEAIVKYLEANQTMTPEEAEAALAEAREELNKAYNAYQAAIKATSDAQAKLAQEKNKTSDFWKDKAWTDVMNAVAKVNGINLSLDPAYPVEVGDVTVDVKAGGIWVPTGEGFKWEYKPFFSDEGTKSSFVRYPNINVIADGQMRESDHVDITTTTIAPAALYVENIKEAMDTVVAWNQRKANYYYGEVVAWNEEQKKEAQKTVKEYTAKNELQQLYVEALQDTVEKCENAYIAALAGQEAYETKKDSAWKAFQEYMLLTYPTVSRKYFVDQYMADTAYTAAHEDSLVVAFAHALAVLGVESLKEAVEPDFQAAAKAEGVVDSLLDRRDNATETLAYKYYKAFKAAEQRWNPEFAQALEAGAVPTFENYKEPASTENYQPKDCAYIDFGEGWTAKGWFIDVNNNKTKDTGDIEAGTAQDSLCSAQYNFAIADAILYKADVDSLRHAITRAKYTTAETNYTTRKEFLNGTAAADGIKQKVAAAGGAYTQAESNYNGEIGNKIAVAQEAFNKGVIIFDYVTFPTLALPEQKYTVKDGKGPDAKGVWADGKAGTTQVALFNAVKAVADGEKQVKVQDPSNWNDPKTIGEAMAAATHFDNFWEGKLADANAALFKAVTGKSSYDPEKDDVSKYIDAEANKRYQAFLNIKDDVEVWKAWGNLTNVYGFYNPDEIDTWENRPDFNEYHGRNAYKKAQFGWLRSSYNVDYDATYVNDKGERKPIYWILYPARTDAVGDRQTHSYKYKIEAAQKEIDEVIPARIAGSKDWWDNVYMKGVKDDVAAAMAVVNTYKGYEAGYQKWVEDRVAAEKAVNDAKKAEFDAREAERAALANYNAKKLIADEGMWVYDKDQKIKKELGNLAGVQHKGDFTFVPFTKAIELLEGNTKDYYEAEKALYNLAKTAWDTAVADKDISLNDVKSILEAIEAKKADYDDNITELNLAKKLLQKTLEYGKLALEVFVQAYDEEIEELDEKIDVYSAIANMYKTIMNYYLGIVEEAVIEEPVEVEGEEE